MTEDWLFEEAPNTAVITIRQIMRGDAPILHVVLDDDGEWQFLGWETPEAKEAMVVGLSSIVQRDPTIKRLYDLPLGWHAYRHSVADAWTREPLQTEP